MLTPEDKTRLIDNRKPADVTADFSRDPGALDLQYGNPRGDQTLATTPQIPGKHYQPGEIIGDNYLLTRLLGRGGMGTVYACKHMVLGQPFAIKILTGGLLDAESWNRFQSEARALARLNHPGIVSIYNMGIDDEQYPFYVMELLSGDSLDTLIRRSTLMTVDEAIDLFIQVADALISAHSHGIIHRDVKPSNLMLGMSRQGKINVKLVDFGIARLSKTGFSSQSQTATGLVFGTPYYMSPEQCDGKKVDERSDIYSFGCTFFEALTGSPPFQGNSALETFMLHQTAEIPTLASRAPDREFPEALELALSKMLSKQPADRYQTMQQLKHDLERVREGKAIIVRTAQSRPVTGSQQTLAKKRNFDDMDVNRPDDMDSVANKAKAKSIKITLVASLIFLLAVGIGAAVITLKPDQTKSKTIASTIPRIPNSDDNISLKASGNGLQSRDEFTLDLIGNKDSLTAPQEGNSKSSIVDPVKLRAYGATEKEIKNVQDFSVLTITLEDHQYSTMLQKHIKPGSWSRTDMGQDAGIMTFAFPTDMIGGFIKVDNEPIVQAVDLIGCNKDSKVCFYFLHPQRKHTNVIDNFGPNDLTGVEGMFSEPIEVIDKLKTWRRLEEFSFFNSLIKAMPGHEDWDEGPMNNQTLVYLEQLRGLKSLGVCGPKVSGKFVAKMPLLKRLTTLKVKRISDIDDLLVELPKFPKIKELWLVTQDLKNKQLEMLTKMPNLETLRIRRSRLTPDSLSIFKRMPHLKQLIIDKNAWSAAEKARFKKALPDCQFEPVAETTYWSTVPKSKP